MKLKLLGLVLLLVLGNCIRLFEAEDQNPVIENSDGLTVLEEVVDDWGEFNEEDLDLNYLRTLTNAELVETLIPSVEIEALIFDELKLLIEEVVGPINMNLNPEIEWADFTTEEQLQEIIDIWFQEWADILIDDSDPATMNHTYTDPVIIKDLIHVVWFTFKEYSLAIPYEVLNGQIHIKEDLYKPEYNY